MVGNPTGPSDIEAVPVRIGTETPFLVEHRYPAERAAIAEVQAMGAPEGLEAVELAIDAGVMEEGSVTLLEASPTYRCTEDCSGCPDATSALKERIKLGHATPNEARADAEVLIERYRYAYDLGARHVMNIGGTIDKFSTLGDLIEAQLDMGYVVSWFTDGIPQLNEDGTTNELFQENLDKGWFRKVATHVSTDYTFGFGEEVEHDLFADELSLPAKGQRFRVFREDGSSEESRRFKSQYSAVMARRSIEAGSRRVVLNMTINRNNAPYIRDLYDQAVALQEYANGLAEATGRDEPTEVLFTFSPMVVRPHQARAETITRNNAFENALQEEDMEMVNAAMQGILKDTYDRLERGDQRILAVSSGYTSLQADPAFAEIAAEQNVEYPDGRPLMLQVEPNGDMQVDPMFPRHEALPEIHSTFGYMDRPSDFKGHPFVKYHAYGIYSEKPWLPNIISGERRDDPNMQPVPVELVVDHLSALALRELEVRRVGEE